MAWVEALRGTVVGLDTAPLIYPASAEKRECGHLKTGSESQSRESMASRRET